MLLQHGNKAFKCPHCDVLATQKWFRGSNIPPIVTNILRDIRLDYRSQIHESAQRNVAAFLTHAHPIIKTKLNSYIPDDVSIATCTSCSNFTLWINKEIIYPRKSCIQPPNIDLDESIKELYLEASSILMDSPKGAAALLRLALQKLLKQVGKSGKNINNDIGELVEEGLSPKIQQALDILRVVGNNAVHPGQIKLDDNKDVAHKLFEILNFIAEELITKPKELDSLYANIIPADTQEHIKQRDSQNK